MVLLNSEKSPLGSKAPEFSLISVDSKKYSLSSFSDKSILIILFICNHCPYVKAIEDRIIALQRYYENKSVQLLGVCSNDPTDYPEDSAEELKKKWAAKDYRFPYLVDSSQEMAKSYGAVCTPDIYVFNQERGLAYHGRIDDSWQDPSKVKKEELKEAVNHLLKGEPVPNKQQSTIGCSIKWKRGS